MKGKMPTIAFRIMAHIGMPIRNFLMPPRRIFTEIDIHPGHRVLDYGCGPGLFSIMAAERTGPAGKVYALDIHPLALKMVSKKARERDFAHVETILTDCRTSLADNGIDRILFLDVLHMIENQDAVMAELARVLKSDGKLFFSDHHLQEEQILSRVTANGYFHLEHKGQRLFCLGKG